MIVSMAGQSRDVDTPEHVAAFVDDCLEKQFAADRVALVEDLRRTGATEQQIAAAVVGQLDRQVEDFVRSRQELEAAMVRLFEAHGES